MDQQVDQDTDIFLCLLLTIYLEKCGLESFLQYKAKCKSYLNNCWIRNEQNQWVKKWKGKGKNPCNFDLEKCKVLSPMIQLGFVY